MEFFSEVMSPSLSVGGVSEVLKSLRRWNLSQEVMSLSLSEGEDSHGGGISLWR